MRFTRRTWAAFLLTHPRYVLHPLVTDGRERELPDCPGNICGTDPTTVEETGLPAPISGPAGTLWRDSIGSNGGHNLPMT